MLSALSGSGCQDRIMSQSETLQAPGDLQSKKIRSESQNATNFLFFWLETCSGCRHFPLSRKVDEAHRKKLSLGFRTYFRHPYSSSHLSNSKDVNVFVGCKMKEEERTTKPKKQRKERRNTNTQKGEQEDTGTFICYRVSFSSIHLAKCSAGRVRWLQSNLNAIKKGFIILNHNTSAKETFLPGRLLRMKRRRRKKKYSGKSENSPPPSSDMTNQSSCDLPNFYWANVFVRSCPSHTYRCLCAVVGVIHAVLQHSDFFASNKSTEHRHKHAKESSPKVVNGSFIFTHLWTFRFSCSVSASFNLCCVKSGESTCGKKTEVDVDTGCNICNLSPWKMKHDCFLSWQIFCWPQTWVCLVRPEFEIPWMLGFVYGNFPRLLLLVAVALSTNPALLYIAAEKVPSALRTTYLAVRLCRRKFSWLWRRNP